MFTGMRIVRDLFALALPAWRIHHVAYFENLLAAAPVDLRDGADEPDYAFLDQVRQHRPWPWYCLRNRQRPMRMFR